MSQAATSRFFSWSRPYPCYPPRLAESAVAVCSGCCGQDRSAVRFICRLLNLAGNAVKFTKQGYVNVFVSCEEKTEEADTIHFCIEDTGIGIPFEKHAKALPAVRASGIVNHASLWRDGPRLGHLPKNRGIDGGEYTDREHARQRSKFHFTVKLPLASLVASAGPPAREDQTITSSETALDPGDIAG